jgi:hypothetical protein
MPTTQEIRDQLNAYDAAGGDNIWQDVILKADWYDADATDALGDGSDRTIVTTAGDTISYSAGTYGVGTHGKQDPGWD